MRERFGAKNPKSWMLRFHTQTGGVTLTAQQPDNNVVRVTLQALAAVLGGTQSLHTNSKDEALALPTEESVTVALRTQQVIAHESGVTNTIDPLAGSFYVEKMTDDLEREALAYIEKIDEMGGMVAAIEQGWVQREIERAAYEYGQSVERQERIVVGVNKFQTEKEAPMELLKIDEEVGRAQVERLAGVKSSRDQARVDSALDAIEAAAKSDENLMPLILEAVRAYASVGEISNALRGVFGEYQESF
jgi:methylmalonyl-CoA mutase, N-terminal domain